MGKRTKRSITVRCEICNDVYVSPTNDWVHEKYCSAFQAAVAHYGSAYVMIYPAEEAMKQEARMVLRNKELPVVRRVAATLAVLRAWFSRSIRMNKYRLNHPAFPEYVSMILNHGQRYGVARGDVYLYLVRQYGTRPGIPAGSSYCRRLKNVIISR